jgi:5'-nucleotidase
MSKESRSGDATLKLCGSSGAVINYNRPKEGLFMNILVTNDDGIYSEGLWQLVRELKEIARVTVVTPESERSAIGTAVSLLDSVKVQKTKSIVDGVTAYITDGTPSDCVVLALGRLITEPVDLVVSGINNGSNQGEDVYISGTVGGALQGYFRGSSAIAISAPRDSRNGQATAARATARLAELVIEARSPSRLFLNVNVPDLPPDEIAGVNITRLARTSHINTVHDDSQERRDYYNLVRTVVSEAATRGTDMYAKEHGCISITPLFTSLFERPPRHFLKSLCYDLFKAFKPEKK